MNLQNKHQKQIAFLEKEKDDFVNYHYKIYRVENSN